MTLADYFLYIGVVGTGVMAGVYVGFSVMIMPALERRPAQDAVGFMQATNVYAVRPGFQLAFSGTAAVAVLIGVTALVADDVARGWLLTGSVAYLLTIVITGGFHMPRNNAFDRVDLSDPEASAEAWATYARPWAVGNHVRALLCIVALVSYVAALAA